MNNVLPFNPRHPMRSNRIPAVKLTSSELAVLSRCTNLQFRLYVAGLRPRMDYKSGVFGLHGGSYQTLINACQQTIVGSGRGVRPTDPSVTKCAIQRALKALEKAGMVLPVAGYETLVFRLPLAEYDEADYSVHSFADTDPIPLENAQVRDFSVSANALSDTTPESVKGSSSLRSEEPASDEPDAAVTSEDEKPKRRRKQSDIPNCPYEAILESWAKHHPEKPQPAILTDALKNKIRKCWKQGFHGKHRRTGERFYTDLESGIEWWDRFLAFCTKPRRLRGSWFNFHWLVKADHFAEIISGNFDVEFKQ